MPHEGQVKELDANKKDNLLQFLQSSQIPIGSACGGHGLCGSCKVIVVSGQQNLSSPNDTEMDLAERNRLPDQERIACQCKILGDIEITTSYW